MPAQPIQEPHAKYPTFAHPTEADADSKPTPLHIEIEPGMISQTGDLYPRESKINIVKDTFSDGEPFSFSIPPDKDHIPTKSDDFGQFSGGDNSNSGSNDNCHIFQFKSPKKECKLNIYMYAYIHNVY